MKKSLFAVAAAAMLSAAGMAGAAEPVQLTESQMDTVSAGATSSAGGAFFAGLGAGYSNSSTGTYQSYTWYGVHKITWADNETAAAGLIVGGTSSASSSL